MREIIFSFIEENTSAACSSKEKLILTNDLIEILTFDESERIENTKQLKLTSFSPKTMPLEKF